ncbi:MAG TPA: T9SS type A sorting domain-containing protein [candidate division Zixibacteria bacterium]|nr:T9SS type A sorting domain-containing protein [candidate division Zixibacteria bacterium]
MELATGEGEVTIRWFGRETESARDPISNLQDFEGYTLQMSPDGVSYTIIGYYDRVNYRGYYLNRDVNGDGGELEYRWEPLPTRPLLYDEIQNLYAPNWDTCLNKPGNITKPIDPEKYNALIIQGRQLPLTPFPNPWCNPDTLRTAVRVRFCDNCGAFSQRQDTILYFVPEGLNLGLDPVRMYPAVTDPDNDSAYWYQYKISGLFPSQPLYFAVVPFDNGMVTFSQKIESQSASPYAGAYLVYPIASDSARRASELQISVYPNPYRIDHDYRFFEKKFPVTGHPQSSQRINFVNLPPKCTIRIYTLDGDLVQQINHDKDPNASDSGHDFWDMLTRNAQKVAAGLYLYSVESNEGRYIGKIIIIQ